MKQNTMISPGPDVRHALLQEPGSYALSADLVALENQVDAEGEAFRALRTHIMARHVGEGRRALAVCAATTGVGCSFVAANLAVALSQIGVKTLLIDANLRAPGIEQYFRPAGSLPGLQQCLEPGSSLPAEMWPLPHHPHLAPPSPLVTERR